MLVMKKYKKREPDIVEAVQFTGGNGKEIATLLGVSEKIYETILRTFNEGKTEMVTRRLMTLELVNGGESCKAFEGDYVTKNTDGELCVIDEATFLSSFEEIE